MFENVLVGVDFRPGGRDAIALASRLREPAGSMTLVHVYARHFLPGEAVEGDRERAEAELEKERAETGVEAELVAVGGPTPGQVLHEEAETRGADLIVLGSCHRGVFGRTMLGDVTRASINGAPCAVAVAPAGYAARSGPLEAIGVAYDGSPESRVALAAARKLAAAAGARIEALHVISLPSYAYGGLAAAFMMGLDEVVEREDAKMKALEGVEGRAEYGLPADDLSTFAKHVDLLVVGSRGYGPWGRLVHGSTSGELARHAGGAVLIVPRPDHPEPPPADAEGAPAAGSA